MNLMNLQRILNTIKTFLSERVFFVYAQHKCYFLSLHVCILAVSGLICEKNTTL